MLLQVERFILDNPAAPYAGLPIQIGQMPPDPDQLVVLYESAGSQPEASFGQAGVYTETPGLTVRSRGRINKYLEPRAVVYALMNLLMRIEALTLNDGSGVLSFFEIVRPDAMPNVFDFDTRSRYVWTVSFSLRKRP